MKEYVDDYYTYTIEDKESIFSTDVEMYQEFLTYCNDYKIEFDRIVIENEENRFTVFPPNQEKQEKYIIFEGSCGSARFSGTAESIEELLEEAINTVGEEKIKLKQKGKSI